MYQVSGGDGTAFRLRQTPKRTTIYLWEIKMKPNRPNSLLNRLRNTTSAQRLIIAFSALMLLGSGHCFSQSQEAGQTMKANIKQEKHIADLTKRIADAGDDCVSLTAEEYDLLLSQPVGTVDGFESLATTAGGIMIGIGFSDGPKVFKTNIQTIFPKIPNIGDGTIFVLFDSVKGSNGLDFLDRMNNTENEEKDFTQLALDLRTAGSKPYWFGSRYVHLLDPSDSMTVRALGELGGDVELSAVSGKVIMYLPTNITGLVLAKGDIGVKKPFADGFLTLKSLAKDKLAFHFSGDTKKIYTWFVYDAKGNILKESGTTLKDGLFQTKAKNPQSIKICQAEIIRREYPFAFVQKAKPASSALFEGIDAARFSAAMFLQTQLAETKNAAPIYLKKNDPIVMSIKGRAVTDLRRSTKYMDPGSPESESVRTKMEAWSEEKKSHLQALGGQSIEEYAAQTHFDASTVMLVFSSFGAMDEKKIPEEWDIRVQRLGNDNYIAEFWEDSHVVHPDAKSEISENARYYKMMALFYTHEKDGSVIFHNPFQPVIDLVNQK